MKIHKIFVADDHQLVIDGIAMMLSAELDLELVSYVNNGRDALERIPIIKPDLCIIDLDMPFVNGLEVIKEIRKNDQNIKLIVLTMHLEKPIVEKLIKAGANGYMLKNTSKKEFLAGIRMVLEGHKFYSSALTENILIPNTIEYNPNNAVKLQSLLSQRELEVLSLLGEGLSSKEIGENLFISPKTVDTYRKSLLKKLEVKNVAGLIKVAIQEGLIS